MTARLALVCATLLVTAACGADRPPDLPSMTSAAPAASTVASTVASAQVQAPRAVEPPPPPRAIEIVLDLSASMRASMPAPEGGGTPSKRGPTRLEAMKAAALDLVSRETEAMIGVVVFGAQAYSFWPITADHEAVRTSVSNLDLGTIDDSASAVGDGLAVAVEQLRKIGGVERTVVLFADSASTGGTTTPEDAAALARASSCRVVAIQVSDGAEADVMDGRDRKGAPRYKGMTFPARPAELEQMATMTHGAFVVAPTADAVLTATRTLVDPRAERRE
ncbi:MAG: VWA domain-containing protein [Polyangiaceae bacterium]